MQKPFVAPVLASVLLASLASGCGGSGSQASSSVPVPSGVSHSSHLRGGTVAAGMTCASCHSPTGFAVDFSQDPVVRAAGATYDPVTKTCSNVSCHGNFAIRGVEGTHAIVRWNDPAVTCSSCHGMPPAGHPAVANGADPRSCNICHSGTVNPDGKVNVAGGLHMNGKLDVEGGSCTACHGDVARVANVAGTDLFMTSAPPVVSPGAAASAAGAHLGHVNPLASTGVMLPIACAECHAVPSDDTHAISPPAQKVVFGPLSTTGAASPSWTVATAGCSATYCHGNFSFSGVTGASVTPVWTDTAPATCTSCHGMPPVGHPPLAGTSTPASCSACHPQSVDADGRIVFAGAHLNGLADVAALGCTSCHGDPARTGNLPGTDVNLVSAPPAAPGGAPAYASGAHLGHVNPTAETVLMAPIACSECHPVPADSKHAKTPPPQGVVFGALSRAGGAAPTFVAGTAGCAASYCHGNFSFNGVSGSNATPTWTDTAPIGCTSCHGMPPTGHLAVAQPANAASCASCHPLAFNPDGSLNQVDAGHLNGKSDVAALGCTSCHGDAGRASNLPGVDVNFASAPPVAPPGAPAYATGAHLGHMNPAAATAVMDPLSCSECHTVPTDNVHASRPPTQRVVFGALASAGGATPTWVAGSAGCLASYCHGNFNFNGVTGSTITPVWTDTTPATCTSCHGMPPSGHPPFPGATTAASCATCHPQSVDPAGKIVSGGNHMNGKSDVAELGCTSCHGEAGRKGNVPGTDLNLASAPPVASPGAPASVVGAHLSHLNPLAVPAIMGPVACAECHVVPTDSSHATKPPPQKVAFGPLARTGGAVPTYVAGSLGCAASYCHGNFSFNGVSGSNATPLWTDTARLTCASCHAMPPTGHPPLTGSVTAASCSACHPQSVDAAGDIVAGGGHLNGIADVAALGCTQCHGDPKRTGSLPGADLNLTSAPPAASPGAPAYATGAHLGHVNPGAPTALRGPIACAECHVVPADSAHAARPPVQKVVFGPLSTSGGAVPTWTAGTAGCAASYCHGNFNFNGVSGTTTTPVWTDTTALTCTSCHGMPPTGHLAVAGPVTASSCSMCHPTSVNPDGSLNLIDRGHLNGRSDVAVLGCTSCHGDPGRVANVAGTDLNLTSAPPVASPGAPAFAAGAHAGHVNPTVATWLMPPIACAECHIVPADSVHATYPPAERVVFGALSTTGGATPAWVATTAGCSATYCHGKFNFSGVTGSSAVPLWSDTSPLNCTSCHGMPPTGHFAVAAPTDAASCSKCHPSAVNADGTINRVDKGHLNGKVDAVSLGCASCHGDATRKGNLADTDLNLASSPPVASPNAPAYAVGAHLGHVNPVAGSAVMAPVACAECHVVPADSKHATSPPAQRVVFGTLSKAGGAVPFWSASSAGCSTSYCHGNFSYNGIGGANATPIWTNTAPLTCTSCHGMPPPNHVAVAAPVTAASCSICHPRAFNADGSLNLVARGHLNGQADTALLGCTACHGDATRNGILAGVDVNLPSAPPVASPGAPAYAVGAHLGHLNPTAASALMGPIACTECHSVPADSAHATSPPAQKVVFGALAKTGGVSPTWTAGTAGCAASYCHGNFSFGGITGSNATPIGTSPTAMTCTSCHGMPPTGHVAVVAPVTAASCNACHPKAVNADGTINLIDRGHMNGLDDTSAVGCATCHGDATRKANLAGTDVNLTSAPPVAPAGSPAYAVGAHLGHMNPTVATYLMAPIACAECHVVPVDSAHATSPPATVVVFGTLSKTGGAAPAFSAGTAGCSATYCHGKFIFNAVTGSNATPSWTSTAALACTSCHGMPPTGHPAFSGTPTAVSCFQCHPQSVNADGTIKQAGGHINGKADGGGCTGCHGDPPATGKHTISDHKNRRCDACHPTGYTSSVTIPAFHNNGKSNLGTQAGYKCNNVASLVGCPTGQTRTCANSCHGSEKW